MNLTKMDLIQALDWLEWTSYAHQKGREQSFIDRHASVRLDKIKPFLSSDVLKLLEDTIADFSTHPEAGYAEQRTSEVCREIIRQAQSGAFEEFILTMPAHPKKWEAIWEDLRSEHIHH